MMLKIRDLNGHWHFYDQLEHVTYGEWSRPDHLKWQVQEGYREDEVDHKFYVKGQSAFDFTLTMSEQGRCTGVGSTGCSGPLKMKDLDAVKALLKEKVVDKGWKDPSKVAMPIVEGYVLPRISDLMVYAVAGSKPHFVEATHAKLGKVKFVFDTEAYLMNDEGKTLETLRP